MLSVFILCPCFWLLLGKVCYPSRPLPVHQLHPSQHRREGPPPDPALTWRCQRGRSLQDLHVVPHERRRNRNPHCLSSVRKTTFYCDQPFVSETTRCVSNDFIEIIYNSGQNVVHFYVWRLERGRELPSRETEKEEVWERELTREKDSMGAKIRTFSQTTNGNVIW